MGLCERSGRCTKNWDVVRTYITLVIHMGPVSAANKDTMLAKPRGGTGDTYIIEKYGWRFIRGSPRRSAGLRCRSYHGHHHYLINQNSRTR